MSTSIVKKVRMDFGPQRYYLSKKCALPGVQKSMMQSSKLNDKNRVQKSALGVQN